MRFETQRRSGDQCAIAGLERDANDRVRARDGRRRLYRPRRRYFRRRAAASDGSAAARRETTRDEAERRSTEDQDSFDRILFWFATT